MIDLIKELKDLMEEKKISAIAAAGYIRCSPRQVERWLKEESVPSPIYREAIRRGIRQIKNL